MESNRFNSTIPQGISALTKLTYGLGSLNTMNCRYTRALDFAGLIMVELSCAILSCPVSHSYLSLNANQLVGSIPDSISALQLLSCVHL
jgi:hypothetical protein